MAVLLLWAGTALVLAGVVGVFRLNTIYLRAKALASATTLGAIAIHLSTDWLAPGPGARGTLTALLFLLSGPVLSHAVVWAARRLEEGEAKNER